MNNRVLELIKSPKIITESDLQILQAETEKMPYAQSIRALYLYGINLYKSENYKENLSKTAAYTTDKKILYQFINSEKISKKEEVAPVNQNVELVSENQGINQDVNVSPEPVESEIVIEIENTEKPVLNKFDVEKIIESEDQENSEFVVVDGEKNRLLYEGEENFLEEKTPEIDLEATKESGLITIKEDLESTDNLIVNDENRSEESISEEQNFEEFSPVTDEKILESSIETDIQEETSTDISFNGIQDFLPNVKFSVPKNHMDYLNPPKKEIKEEKPETIASKSEYKEPILPEISEDEMGKDQISFENTQSFEISELKKIERAEDQSSNLTDLEAEESQINFENTESFDISESREFENNIIPEKSEEIELSVPEWKPMTFSANIPDALIGKQEAEKPKAIVEEKAVEIEVIKEPVIQELPVPEENKQTIETERPILNVSFFGNEVSKIEEKIETPAAEKADIKEAQNSNVGTFINTWQSWLKIDRPSLAEDKKVSQKEKIIENFIENNPKISQLKEESSYIVKEKKDDISHLMTETLAKLYTEQKLYSKAIKAYEILSEKYPHKKDYFEEKIEEVKDLRKPQ